MKEYILAHKKQLMMIFDCAFLVFIGCFTFPVFQFSKEAPDISRGLNLMITLMAYYEIGLLESILYGSKKIGIVAGINLGMTLLGFLCRFLLEYGEVSNTYNFTMPNITLHLLVAVCVTTLTSLFPVKST